MLESGSPSHRNLGLDLLRALAIVLVLTSHFGDTFASLYGGVSPHYVSISGMFGVELFFVLSGFLIGNLLLRIVRTEPNWRSWLAFMIRRWMRTLPLYFIWLGVLLLIWPPLDHTLSHVVHYATLTQNLLWRMPHDKWFGVSWSLTVEEWFYLLFSAALIGSVAATGTRKCVWYVIALFIAAPVAARLILPTAGDWSQTTYETVGLRLDAIAYGVVLAKLSDTRAALYRHPWLALGCGLPIIAFVWVQASVQALPVPGPLFLAVVLTMTSTGFALCFPAALRLIDGRNWLARGIRQMSAQSYGLYIMHLSILDLVGYRVHERQLSAAMGIVLVLVLTFGLSYLSFRYVESPILARRPRQAAGRETLAPDYGPVPQPADA
jgi:peptidoglycan/LPS O-acetylase OafA/YrhL